MNAPLTVVNIPSLQMAEDELIRALESSMYPGAKLESIKLVIGYCRASNLDPMQKPVHIVPMDVKTDKKNGNEAVYEKRDVIMPGIGLYRVNAVRTGAYAGVSDPEFGPTKTLEFSGEKWENGQKVKYPGKLEYPEWCKVTVRRIVQGHIVEFSAKELWTENYATSGKWSDAPNAMWKRRPYAQLAKCAEAQALRKAFPEIGAQPTAEEMEGKTMDAGGETFDGTATTVAVIEQPKSKSGAEAEKPADQTKQPTNGASDKLASDGMKGTIRKQLANAGLTELDLHGKFGCDADGVLIEGWTIDSLKFSSVNDVIAWIKGKAGAA